MKYKLELFGWQMWFQQQELDQSEIQNIEDYVNTNNLVLEDSWWEIEGELGMDVFDVEFVKPFWYDEDTVFKIYDTDSELISEFYLSEITDHFEFDENAEGSCISVMPELSDKSGYLMKIEESKGGIAVFHFESDEQPLPTDFSALGGMIEAPDSYYEFVENLYFKGKLLEETDPLDSVGKAMTVKLYK